MEEAKPDLRPWMVGNDGDYKVYAPVPGSKNILTKYLVVAPGGHPIGYTATKWGARRVIGKHKAAEAEREAERRSLETQWWHRPIIYKEAGHEDGRG